MQYSNPKIPEGINTSKTNPLKEFAVLTAGVIFIAILILAVLVLLVDFFADKIPFQWEKEIPIERVLGNKDSAQLPAYINALAQKVISNMQLPAKMDITVHYVNNDTVNAFATLGGHIVIYRGLLEKLTYEDELAGVIAHEVAHIKYRHPILGASHGLAVGLVLSIISSSSDGIVSSLLGNTSMITVMKFSRDYEYRADKDAIELLVNLYGHAGGALGLFDIFKASGSASEPIEFLNTHPLTENRISQTRAIISEKQLTNQSMMTGLPKKFVSWLAAEKLPKN
jgi:predicted Zn-dependent protease